MKERNSELERFRINLETKNKLQESLDHFDVDKLQQQDSIKQAQAQSELTTILTAPANVNSYLEV